MYLIMENLNDLKELNISNSVIYENKTLRSNLYAIEVDENFQTDQYLIKKLSEDWTIIN